MTTFIPSRPATAVPTTHTGTSGGSGGILLSEWTKLRSVRSTMWSLLLLVVLTLGFTGLSTAVIAAQWSTTDAAQRSEIMANPLQTILTSGVSITQLTVCVLGVIAMSGEYATGMIRSSLLAVPKRIPMFWAKCAVFAAVVFSVAELVAFASFFLGSAILHSKAPIALTDPGVLRAVVGVGLYLTVLALFALAIGAIVRHSAGAVTGVIGFVLVLAPLAQLLPGSLGAHIHSYLPSEAGRLITSAQEKSGAVLGPWQGFGVFCAGTAALLAVAGYLLKHRDA
jgi:ABC-2 type transport system permease protein